MSQPNEGKPLLPQPMKGEPVPPPTPWEQSKGKVYALILIALLVGISALSAAMYQKKFDGTVPVTLKADRAGLQMHKNNRVKIRGVDLGRVDDVSLNEAQDGVDIRLLLDPDLLKQIPANATVSLEQLSAFGNKAVQINYPANPAPDSLHEGSVIAADHISVEVNSTFDSLMTLLNRVQPSKLNAVLGGLANTFEGNGDVLGADITQANAYLKKFNGDLPALKRDWRSAGGFANVYAGAGNSIADLVRNAGTISDTFGDKREAFEGVLTQFGKVGDEIDDFFGENADPLVNMLKSIRPFTTLLDEYAPVITCFIDGQGVTYDNMNNRFFNNGGAEFEVNFVQAGSTQMYHYPQDLPSIGPGKEKGPNCRGLPAVTPAEDNLADYTTDPPSFNQRQTNNSPRLAGPGEAPPGVDFPPIVIPPLNAKANANAKPSAVPPLVQFFGPRALYPNAPIQDKAGK
jgi:phospholipid/cholesterol/gamma-HCH transport system substrate-binding protein